MPADAGGSVEAWRLIEGMPQGRVPMEEPSAGRGQDFDTLEVNMGGLVGFSVDFSIDRYGHT